METDFDYTLVRRPFRRSLTISISPENQIRILAPVFLSAAKIREFVRRKSDWILKQFEKNVRRPRPDLRKFESGETFPFCGTDMILEVQEAKTGKLEAGPQTLKVWVPEKLSGEERRDYIAWRIEDWYRAEAVNVFRERVDYYQRFVGPQVRTVRVRQFRGQWGSASRARNLSFNWRLLLAPFEILDYVVVHELAHFEHLNHSPRFWTKVEEILPDYKPRRRWLSAYGRFLWLRYIMDRRCTYDSNGFSSEKMRSL